MKENLITGPGLRKRLGGISHMTLWRWVKAGTLPQPTKINKRNYWPESVVDAVMGAKPESDSATQDRPQSTRCEVLQCRWESISVISDTEIEIAMPPENCCDMRGAISVARNIMPGVRAIYTVSGGSPDTEYRCIDGKWRAFCKRPNTGA